MISTDEFNFGETYSTNIYINDSINNISEQMNLSLCFGEYDQCGVCGGDNSPNTGLCDCNGTPNGLAEQDCFGTCNGTATLDNCGNCYGGNTGIDACVQDECGVSKSRCRSKSMLW